MSSRSIGCTSPVRVLGDSTMEAVGEAAAAMRKSSFSVGGVDHG
jgi:hypothetical protein